MLLVLLLKGTTKFCLEKALHFADKSNKQIVSFQKGKETQDIHLFLLRLKCTQTIADIWLGCASTLTSAERALHRILLP